MVCPQVDKTPRRLLAKALFSMRGLWCRISSKASNQSFFFANQLLHMYFGTCVGAKGKIFIVLFDGGGFESSFISTTQLANIGDCRYYDKPRFWPDDFSIRRLDRTTIEVRRIRYSMSWKSVSPSGVLGHLYVGPE